MPPFPTELVALVLCGVGTDIREGRRAIVNPPILRRYIHVWRITVPLADEAAPRGLEEEDVRGLRRANDTMPMRRSFLRQLDTPNEHKTVIERPRFNLFPHLNNETLPMFTDFLDRIRNGGVSIRLNGERYTIKRDPLTAIRKIQKLALEVTGRSCGKGDLRPALALLVAETLLRIVGRPTSVGASNVDAVIVHRDFAVIQGY